MKATGKYKWLFRSGFRKGALGWKASRTAIERVGEAVTEITRTAKKSAALGAEGAVVFFEVVSPAFENVDSSSGSLGSAINRAVAELVPIIAKIPDEDAVRDAWLQRLWQAYLDDGICYIERLSDYWGELCATPQRASKWADELLPGLKESWRSRKGGYFRGASACLSCLLTAERHEELLALLETAPHVSWHSRRYGVRALAALGRTDEAVRYAEASRGLNDSPLPITVACERILLSAGLVDEAYSRYALLANAGSTNLATFRTIAKKYPHKQTGEILEDLVARSPGGEGKWFATAKALGLFKEAIKLANASPCDPRTLTRAARDFAEKKPEFALEVGLAALKWLAQGHVYEITHTDVRDAYRFTFEAAKNANRESEVRERVEKICRGALEGTLFSLLARDILYSN